MVENTGKSFSVLFFATFDSMNYWIPPLIDEMSLRGHQHKIIVRDESDLLNNKMFNSNQYSLASASRVQPEIVDDFDFVVLPPIYVREYTEIIRRVVEKRIFSISSSYLLSSIVMRCCPDLVFTLGEAKFKEFSTNGLHYSCIATGNPQYDKLLTKRPTHQEIKNVLVIDQGGYPYGSVGKNQFAGMLAQMAVTNPTMQFMVKPRYTKSEIGSGQMTHQLSESLSDYIDFSIPNLNLLDTPVILEDIIFEYDAMISTWSTAYYAALMAKIPLMIVEGFDSIDVFDVRKDRIEQAYAHLRRSGVVVGYTNIDYFHLNFGFPAAGYVAQEVQNPVEPCSPQIIDLMEFLKVNLVDKGHRIIGTFQKSLVNFTNDFDRMPKEDCESPHYKYWNILRFELNLVLQEAVYQNRSMSGKLDLSALERYIANCEVDCDILLPIPHYIDQATALIQQSKMKLFGSEDILSIIENDSILQDFYLDWLYDTKQYDIILHADYRFKCTGSLNYYKALIALPKKKMKAFRLLFAFLDELFARNNVIVYLKERRLAQSMTPFFSGINKFYLFFFLLKTKKYVVFTYLNEGAVANSPLLSYFKLKYLVQSGKSQIAETTYQRFVQKHVSTNGSGLFARAIFLLMKGEYKKIQSK
jgi:hypothetical protein